MKYKVGDKVIIYGYNGEVLEHVRNDIYKLKIYGVSDDEFIVGMWQEYMFRKATKLDRALK